MSDDEEEYVPVAVQGRPRPTAGELTANTPELKVHRAEVGEGAAIDAAKRTDAPQETAQLEDGPTPSLSTSGQASTGVLAAVYLKGHEQEVRSVAIRPCGTAFVSGGGDGMLRMWDYPAVSAGFDWTAYDSRGAIRGLKATREIRPFRGATSAQNQPIASVAWLRDGTHFLAAEDGPCALLVRADGKTLGMTPRGPRSVTDVVSAKGHVGRITDVAGHPQEARRAATAAADGTVRVWSTDRIEGGSLYAAKHGVGSVVQSVQALGCGWAQVPAAARDPLLVSCGSDGRVQLWNCNRPYVPRGAVLDVAILPTGSSSAAGAGGAASLLDPELHLASPSFAGFGTTAALTAVVCPWGAQSELAVRTRDGGLHFFDLRATGNGRIASSLTGLRVCGDSAPLLVARPRVGPPMLYTTASNCTLAQQKQADPSTAPTSHLVAVGAQHTVQATYGLRTEGAEVTAMACHDSTQQLLVGDTAGRCHAMVYPLRAAVAAASSTIALPSTSWLTVLKTAHTPVSKDEEEEGDNDGTLPAFLW